MMYNRQSIRLHNHDYSEEGVYFITICTQNMLCLFGNISKDEMILSDAGKMIEKQWMNMPNRFQNIELDEFVIMPNHLHGIVIVNPNARADTRPARTNTIGEMICAFKSITSNEYINGVKNLGWPVFDQKIWHRNYYEHIIRNIVSLDNIRQYIKQNPANWKNDQLHS